jgi:hypothetical protein
MIWKDDVPAGVLDNFTQAGIEYRFSQIRDLEAIV